MELITDIYFHIDGKSHYFERYGSTRKAWNDTTWLRNDLLKELTTDVLCIAKARFEELEKLKLRFQKTQTDIWGKIPELKKSEDQEKAKKEYSEMNQLVDSVLEIKGKL